MLIKICCIQDAAESRAAVEAGATHVGLVSEMPSGPGPLPDADIARLAAAASPLVTTVLLTSRTTPAGIVGQVLAAGVDVVQLVAMVGPDVRYAVRQALPGIAVWQVVHVEDGSARKRARDATEGSDLLLLDSGRPSASVPELGGTGRTHDWALSAEIVRASSIPVILAGGLRPDNVDEAVATVAPAGVDVCSGVRDAAGVLDGDRLRAFVQAVRRDS